MDSSTLSDPAAIMRQKKAGGHRLATLTAYDYAFGRILDDLGLDLILVGDSLGMVQLGHRDTTQVTIEIMEHHTRAVAAGVRKTLLVSDLPAGSYTTPDQALSNARRLVAAGAKAVKVEGGNDILPQIQAILADGIPVLGHLGMLPQHVREEGGYHIKGESSEEAETILADALALDEAGVLGIVLELVQPDAAEAVTMAISCPTIGIGSGEFCDGNILVIHDLLGLFPWFKPRFVTPKADLAGAIGEAVRSYCDDVRGTSSDSAA